MPYDRFNTTRSEDDVYMPCMKFRLQFHDSSKGVDMIDHRFLLL